MAAPVVVCVDDLDRSPHALELAGLEAELRGAPLWIAHAYQRIPPAVAAADDGWIAADAVLQAAVEPLAGAVNLARADHPDVAVRCRALAGRPARGLVALAEEASLLVLGHRGRSGFAGMLFGSVELSTVGHAPCPVAVARGTRRTTDRVLVGVDVTDGADAASSRAQLDFAFAEAVLRGAELVVLHVWEDRGYFDPDPSGESTGDHLSALDRDRRTRLDALLEPGRREHPGVVVDVRIAGGPAARRLVDASGHADLLVVGSRPHHDSEWMRPGGLACVLLYHAQCPVVIVPEYSNS